jgi:hypothetical protein
MLARPVVTDWKARIARFLAPNQAGHGWTGASRASPSPETDASDPAEGGGKQAQVAGLSSGVSHLMLDPRSRDAVGGIDEKSGVGVAPNELPLELMSASTGCSPRGGSPMALPPVSRSALDGGRERVPSDARSDSELSAGATIASSQHEQLRELAGGMVRGSPATVPACPRPSPSGPKPSNFSHKSRK